MPEQPKLGESDKHEADSPIAVRCRTYAASHRDVFLDEILRFIRGAHNTREELAAIRGAAKIRRHTLRGSGKRGRPCGAKRPPSRITQASGLSQSDTAFFDPHMGFRSICMVLGDRADLRPQFLDQILPFIGGADKRELALLREAVAKRAKRLKKKRGRPAIADDNELLSQSRALAWLRIVDGMSAEDIATKFIEMGIWETKIVPPVNNKDGEEIQPGNIQSIRGQLWRLEKYMAAVVWEAVPPSYVIQEGAHTGDLKPGALENKHLQQLVWIRTGLPFPDRPEECKRIVTELWPRGRHAYNELTERKIAYLLKKVQY